MKLLVPIFVAVLLGMLPLSHAQEAAGPPVRNVEDLLRGMPITGGLYSEGKANPATCNKATQELGKVAVGRSIDLQFAFDQRMSEYDPDRGYLVYARSLPMKHRHRLDEILVRFQIPVKGNEALRPKFRPGVSIGVKGTIKKVEFGPEGNKVMLLVTLGDLK